MASANFNGRAFRLDLNIWLINPQDVSNNRSRIGWELWIVKTGGDPSFRYDSSSWSANIDGESHGGTFTYDFRNYSSLRLGGGEKWVGHEADGTKTFNSSASADGGYPIGTAGIGTFGTGLPTIPRASTPSVSGGASFDAGAAITINTNRASSSFTHTLEYTFGAASGTIGTGVGASTSWTPPMSLLQQIPNSPSGTGTLTCKTYSGATLIGTKQITFTLNAPASAVPTIGGLTLAEGTSAVASAVGKYVQGQSTLDWAITGAAGVQGSTIAAFELQVGSQAFTGQTGTTAAIADSGPVTVTAKVTDSRGRVGTSSQVVSVLAWAAPAITSAAIQRALSNGTPDPNGTYVRVDLVAAVSSLLNGGFQKNALRYRTRARVRDTTTWTDTAIVTPGGVTVSTGYVVAGPFDESLSYDVRVEVLDLFATSAAQAIVTVATVTMDWGDGTLGVGKFHEEGHGTLDVAGEIFSNGAVVDPIGSGKLWFTDTPPAGHLLLQGQNVSRADHPGLFALWGTTYGAGNGSTTFGIPDLRFRVPVGYSPADAEFNTLGKKGGAKTHTLTVGEIPPHNHQQSAVYGNYAAGGGGALAGMTLPGSAPTVGPSNQLTLDTGGGGAHNNLQPYITVNFIVKAF